MLLEFNNVSNVVTIGRTLTYTKHNSYRNSTCRVATVDALLNTLNKVYVTCQ